MALDNIIGQQEEKNMLRVPLLAYKAGRSIGNILLTGPAGNGKTHSAECIADELGIPAYRFDVSSSGKKDLTTLLARSIDECRISEFVLILDEIQSVGTNASLSGALLDMLDTDKRIYQVHKNGNKRAFPRIVIVGCTNEPWKITRALDSRFSLYRIRLTTPTDEEIALIMKPRITGKLDPKMLTAFAVAAGNHARKANGIVDHINTLMDLKEPFTIESVLCDLGLTFDGAQSSHLEILSFLAGNQKGEYMGWATQSETARHARMHLSELKYYIEFLERRGYVVINERSQLEITDNGRNRMEEI